MLLTLSSNVFWNTFRSIAGSKIVRLGASLKCPLYVKEEWIRKKSIF